MKSQLKYYFYLFVLLIFPRCWWYTAVNSFYLVLLLGAQCPYCLTCMTFLHLTYNVLSACTFTSSTMLWNELDDWIIFRLYVLCHESWLELYVNCLELITWGLLYCSASKVQFFYNFSWFSTCFVICLCILNNYFIMNLHAKNALYSWK